MVRHVLRIAAAVLVTLCAAQRQPAGAAPLSLPAQRVTVPPNLDGNFESAAWQAAPKVELTWDLGYQRAAAQRTQAALLYDATTLYVAYRAWQEQPVVANQRTNDVDAVENDDFVLLRLWPDDSSGFAYRFVVSATGAHNQQSTENAAYAPTWRSYGFVKPDGYVVMLAIPLNIMKGAGGSTWRVQFYRNVARTGEHTVWSYDVNQQQPGDLRYAGYLRGISASLASLRPKPRLAVYGLGQAGPERTGGNTSASGADLSFPITRKTTVVATFHPDFSNVEADQQSISPTEFRRSFREVRPFFTQLLNYYNNLACNNCIDYRTLYTPAIPTPRNGYALEGHEGRFSFAGFNAVGAGQQRSDNAQTITYSTPDNARTLVYQRVGALQPGLQDVSDVLQLRGGNLHNFGFYATAASERGTLVSDRSQAGWREIGAEVYTSTSGLYGALRKVGAQYAPLDGFTEHSDIAGYSLYGTKTWNYDPKRAVQSLTLSGAADAYHGTGIGTNQFDFNPSLSLTTRTQFNLSLALGSNYLAVGPGQAAFFNQNGVSLSYKAASSTPTSLSYYSGRFDYGSLRSWFRSTTLLLGPRGSLSLEADDTRYRGDDGTVSAQWLERVSYAYQIDRGTSLALGVRKIVGTEPPVFSSPSAVSATNVSAALHRRLRADELYLAYGDPNRLRTRPAFIVKYVHYFGAEKGT
jgi:hypothetical protein